MAQAICAYWGRIKPKGSFLTLVVAVVVVGFVFSNLQKPPQADDAFISYRYARNLINGHGLVFNIGERVEGFSNMLWTLLIAGGMFFGLDAAHLSHLLALLSSGALLGTSFGFAYRVHPVWYTLLVPFALLCSAPFAVWSISGLETPLYAALVVGAFWAAYEEKWRLAAFLSGLCFWTRPDGGLVGAVILAVAFFQCKNRKEWMSASAIWVILVASLTVFRLIYYGRLVPNTFHAKVGGIPLVHGLHYVKGFLLTGPVYVLPLAFLELRNRRLWSMWLFVLCHTVYVLLIGGDVFFHSRFFLPIMPLFLIAAVSASRHLKPWTRRAAWGAIVILWCLSTEYIPISRTHALDKAIKHRHAMELCGRRFARLAQQYDGPVACVGIGAVGYYSDARILDMVGLVSPEVANRKGTIGFLIPGHQCSNPDWILSQRPALIVLGDSAILPSQIEMLGHPSFQSQYVQRGDVFVREDLVLPQMEQ